MYFRLHPSFFKCVTLCPTLSSPVGCSWYRWCSWFPWTSWASRASGSNWTSRAQRNICMFSLYHSLINHSFYVLNDFKKDDNNLLLSLLFLSVCLAVHCCLGRPRYSRVQGRGWTQGRNREFV